MCSHLHKDKLISELNFDFLKSYQKSNIYQISMKCSQLTHL